MKNLSTLHPLFSSADIQGLVFDLDGTLIDSAADIIHAMRVTFQQAGIGTIPDSYCPDNLHGTGEGIMRDTVADMGWSQELDYAALREQYIAVYAKQNHKRTSLYSHVSAVLKECQQAGIPMAICTNKLHDTAISAMQTLGIYEQFGVISGSDTWSAAKPSPIPLNETIRCMGLQPSQCLYFGDTSVDAACAEAAGVRFILHESGYGDVALSNMPRHFSFQSWGDLLSPQLVMA